MKIAGVDLGGRKVAISVFSNGVLEQVQSLEVPKSTRARELRTLATWAHGYLQDCPLICLEEPLIGRGVQASLQIAHTYGAVLATLGDTHPDTRSVAVPVKTWKKTVIGNGNASKEDVGMWLKSSHPAYAVQCGGNQDRIDATCIGLYGVQLERLARKLVDL